MAQWLANYCKYGHYEEGNDRLPECSNEIAATEPDPEPKPDTTIACPACGWTTWKRVEDGHSHCIDLWNSESNVAHEDEDDHFDTDSDYFCFGCDRSVFDLEIEYPDFDAALVPDAFASADWS